MPFEEYNPTVMDHFLNPRNTGELAKPTHMAFVRNPVCGDQLKLTLVVREGKVADARAKTFGTRTSALLNSSGSFGVRNPSIPSRTTSPGP